LHRRDLVDRAAILAGEELRVLWVVVVEDLHLHADVGGVALVGRPDADAVVAARLGQELDAEGEVAELLLEEEVAAAVLGADDRPDLDDVAAPLAADELPARERFPVEAGDEARRPVGRVAALRLLPDRRPEWGRDVLHGAGVRRAAASEERGGEGEME